jgi:hypothetical protein
MWQWLKDLWGPNPEEIKQIVSDLNRLDPYRESASPHGSTNNSEPTNQKSNNITDIIRDVAQEVAEEQRKLEHKFFSDEKLKYYFRQSIKHIVSKLDTNSYDFVLLHDHNADVPQEVFNVFSQIFVKACSQLGIAAKPDMTYIHVGKPSFRKFLKTIQTKTPQINIDEKARTMLNS